MTTGTYTSTNSRIDLARGLYGGVGYLGTAMLTLLLSENLFDTTLPLVYRSVLTGVAIGALPVVAIYFLSRRMPARLAVSIVMAAVWTVVFLLAMANVGFGWVALKGYGDRLATILIMQSGNPFPRWLAGTALLEWVHAAVWEMPVVAKVLPATLQSVEGYVHLMSILTMGVATLVLLAWRWGRLSVVLPTLVPVWWMFSAGYIEYYPFIAWILLALLVWLFEGKKRLEQQSPYTVGFVAAALPVIYIAFAPLGAILFFAYTARRPREFGKLLATSLASGLILIRILSPVDVDDYFRNLYLNMQFNKYETYDAYNGYALFEGSNFFTPGFALSKPHLLDVLYMYVFGGSLVFPVVLGVLTYWHRPSVRHLKESLSADLRPALAAVLIGWHVFYLFFYIARLGPLTDIDLFFSTFIVIAYFAGFTADRLIDRGQLRESLVPGLIAVSAGTASVTVTYLLFVGLPLPA